MIENILHNLYKSVPFSMRKRIGSSQFLKPLRNALLRRNGSYKESKVLVKRKYFEYNMEFFFFASIKVASHAKNSGIENTILRNSIQLIKEYKSNENNAIVLDIGANFGYLSHVWASSISKHGKVIAFEPNLNVYHSFNKSINSNNLETIIQLHNQAVGIKDCVIELFVNSTSSNTLNTKEEKQNKTVISMISIDSFTKSNNITTCDLVKIDVDGIELDILKGSQEFINKCKPIFIVEINGDQRILDFFTKNSYEIRDMNLKVFQPGDKLPLNIFCIPKNK